MENYNNGSWTLNLNGICFNEMSKLGKMLVELGEKGSIEGVEFDLDTLRAEYNSRIDEIILKDEEGNEY